ncbi:MAG: SRPBCC family protein [Acidimicrobiia bacterium]
MPKPRHVHETYIRTTPERLWQALTDPTFTSQYFYDTAVESTWEPGAPYRYTGPEGPAIEGTVLEAVPGRRLVMTYRALFDAEAAAEEPSRVTWEITPLHGVCRLTLLHEDFGGLSRTWGLTLNGWRPVIDGLKTLLETGEPIGHIEDDRPDEPQRPVDLTAEEHRDRGIEIYNATWELIGKPERTAEEDEAMIRSAYASAYHWSHAARRTSLNDARGAWMLARVHTIAGRPEAALHHAERCAAIVEANGIGDFDLAYAHEAKARAFALVGRDDEARAELAAARAVVVADDEDRAILVGDLDAEPWFGLAGS